MNVRTSLHSLEMPKQVNVRCGPRFPARHTWVSPDVGSQLNVQALPKSVSLGKHFNKFLFSLMNCRDGWLSAVWRRCLPAYGQGAGQQAKFLWPENSSIPVRQQVPGQSFKAFIPTQLHLIALRQTRRKPTIQSKQECLVCFFPHY